VTEIGKSFWKCLDFWERQLPLHQVSRHQDLGEETLPALPAGIWMCVKLSWYELFRLPNLNTGTTHIEGALLWILCFSKFNNDTFLKTLFSHGIIAHNID
jgi:hypothetical protein